MTLRTIATALAAGLVLAACGSSDATEQAAATPDPTTAPSPTPSASPEAAPATDEPVDLMVIPDQISEAYVAELVATLPPLYGVLGENTDADGGLNEVGYGTLTLNVTANEIDAFRADFDTAWDDTLVRDGGVPKVEDHVVYTATPECISVFAEIDWSPFATKYADLDARDDVNYWIKWLPDTPADGSSAWDVDKVRLHATGGGITEDPCDP